MFYKYLISNVNNEEVLYLFIENNYEFAQDFNKKNDENKNLKLKIKKYIDANKINFSGKRIFLVINGLIIGSLLLFNDDLSTINKYIDLNQIYPVSQITTSYDDEIIDVVKEKSNDVSIKSNKTITQTNFDLYLEKAIFNNIPITYEKEALKAMSVLIRTNCLKDLKKYGYINDVENYMSSDLNNSEYQQRYSSYLEKLSNSISETDNEYLSFNNDISYLPISFSDNSNIRISNYGMNLMAKAGYNYSQILAHYYPNTVLKNTQRQIL